MATDKIPYLTIAITNKCNFNCYYCSPDGDSGMGEAYGTSTEQIDSNDLEEKILIAENEGITKVRFTGGEPLLVKGMTDILRFIEKETNLEYALATNGSLVDRFVDLAHPFQHKHYYRPGFKGGYSIKVVLPTLFPDDDELDYKKLGSVQNGGDAMDTFARLHLLSDKSERDAIRKDLLAYCRLDTLAMVRIWKELHHIAGS